MLYTSFPSWPSICWSCRLLLECLSHLPPSLVFCEWQQPRWYCLRVISLLMRPDLQLWAFNAKVTTFFWNCSSTMLPWLAHCVSTFCLGRPGRLSLRACRSSFLRFRLTEDRIVLGDISWQLGLSLFILGCFFLLGMGPGPHMKWTGTADFFDPTSGFEVGAIKLNYFYILVGYMIVLKKLLNGYLNSRMCKKSKNSRMCNLIYSYILDRYIVHLIDFVRLYILKKKKKIVLTLYIK